MILVKPSHEIIQVPFGNPLELIEVAGRTCYKSEGQITTGSARKFVKMITKMGHHSVIEHISFTVRFICDRGVTHELVRHRLAAYSQESTRYCNYSGGVTFVIPPWVNANPCEIKTTSADGTGEYIRDEALKVACFEDNTIALADLGTELWLMAMADAEQYYLGLLADEWSPQQARSVLPNSLKTEIVMTANVREWRHVLTLRTSKAAHPQMSELMIPLLEEFQQEMPEIFGDIEVK